MDCTELENRVVMHLREPGGTSNDKRPGQMSKIFLSVSSEMVCGMRTSRTFCSSEPAAPSSVDNRVKKYTR